MKKNAKQLLVLFLTVCVLCASAAGGLCSAPAAGEETHGNNAAASNTEQQQNAMSPYYKTYILNTTTVTTDKFIDEKIRNILENQDVQLFTNSVPAPDGTSGQTAPINWDPDSIKNTTIVVTVNITDPLQNNSSPPNGYPANRVIAGMAGTLPQAKLADDEAVVPLTVDNFWIADRKPATVEEKKNQPKVILGRNRGSELTVNGEATGSDEDKAKALIAMAKSSVTKASSVLSLLEKEENRQELQKAINQAQAFISKAENATDEELVKTMNDMGYDFLRGIVNAPALLADKLYAEEQGTLDADSLKDTLGIELNDLTAFAARSGFTLDGLIRFFADKKLTLADFADMMNELEASNYTIQDFIEAGVLDNEGLGGLVVRLVDTPEGIQAQYTSASGTTYQFGGAVVLSNGKLLQFGDPVHKEDTAQKFGPVDMDGKGTTCFFSTVYSEALGLFPGEMIISRYMLIQGKDGKPLLYWFDETGAPSVIGPLDQVDPDKSIATLFHDAGYENGLPLELDEKSFPTGYQYLTHSLQYTVSQAPTCVRAGIELITCANCDDLSLARDLPAVGHRLTAHPPVDPTCTETGVEAYWSCDRCRKYFSDAQGKTEIQKDSWIIAKDPAAHPEGKLTGTAAQAATCAAAGNSAYWSCSECGKYFSDAEGKKEIQKDSWIIASDPAAHPEGKLTETAAKAATCTAAGNSAYWSCSECGRYFSDAEGKKEIQKDSWIIAKDPAAHPEGKLTGTAAQAATCAAAGNSAYWTCSECGKYFSDAEGKTEIQKASWIIAKDPAAHPEGKLTGTAAQAATCAAAGNSAYWSCSECGKYFSDAEGKTEIQKDSWIIAKDPAAHPEGKLTGTAAQAATCAAAGNSAYWSCSECGRYFSDAEGKTEIQKDSWIIAKDPAAHPEGKLTGTAAQAATCAAAGNSAYWTCSECSRYFSDAEGKTEIQKDSWIIAKDPAAHPEGKLTGTAAQAATCAAAGNSAYWSCSECGRYFSDAEGKTEIQKDSWIIAKDPAAHPEGKLTGTAAQAATCAAAGNSAYWSCSECGKYFSDAQGKTEIKKDSWIIAKDPAAHPEGKLTGTPAQAATCAAAGNSAYWSCSECGKYFSDAEGKTEIQKDSWIIAKDPAAHPEGKLTETPAKAATCTEDGYSAYWSCSECNKLFSDAQGKNEIEAPVPIAAGHLWGQPSWEWTIGLSSAKATFTCERDSSHTHTETDTAPVKIETESIPATMDAPGKAVYQATVKIDGTGAEYTDKQEKTLRLTPYISGSPVTEIGAAVDETVGARLNLCFSDCRLTYSDGTRTDDEIQYSLRYSISSGTITTSTPSTDVKGQSFSVTVTFAPTEKSDIYESVTETYKITVTE